MSKSTSSRRNFLRGASAVAVVASTAVCTPNPGQTSGVPTTPPPTAARTPSAEDIRALGRQHVRDHWGQSGDSLWRAQVTNPRYLDRLSQRAAQFAVAGRTLSLKLDTTTAMDLGGIWANDLVLSAAAVPESSLAAAEVIRQGGEVVKNPVAVFSFRRYFDVAASRKHGLPLLAHVDRLVVIDLPSPESVTSPSPSPTIAPVAKFWVLSRSGVTAISLPAGSGTPASTNQIVSPRETRPSSYLDYLVAAGQDDRVEYLRHRETPTNIRPEPQGSNVVAGDIIYSEAVVETTSETAPAAAMSSQSSAVTSATLVPLVQVHAEEGRFQTERYAVYGEPTTWLYGTSMPDGYGSCGGMTTASNCETCAIGQWAFIQRQIGNALTACFGWAAFESRLCGGAALFCLLGLGLVCAVTGAGTWLIGNSLFTWALKACKDAYPARS